MTGHDYMPQQCSRTDRHGAHVWEDGRGGNGNRWQCNGIGHHTGRIEAAAAERAGRDPDKFDRIFVRPLIAAADAYDAEHGIVRVDTRDEATVENIASVIHEHIFGSDYPDDEAMCCARAVIARLAGLPVEN